MNATTAQLVDHLPARKRRPSLWLALLWKEWRQQRLVFVLLAATCLGGYAIWCKANGWRGDGATLTALLAFAALCLGVNAFATDTDERSGEFLDRLPVSAWRLLIVRYLVTMALASLCFVLPVVLMTPVGDDWGLCTWGALVWGPERLVPVAFVIASSAVALTGALSRSGLGGMSTWLLAASVTLPGGCRARLVRRALLAGARLEYPPSRTGASPASWVLGCRGPPDPRPVRDAPNRPPVGFHRPKAGGLGAILVRVDVHIVGRTDSCSQREPLLPHGV
jgi:hypothetical protein